MTRREALLAMGYSEQKAGVWLKPIGFQCFVFREERDEWGNYFRNVQGQVERWETKSLKKDEENALSRLKMFEAYTRTDIYVDRGESHFELLNVADI